MLGGAEQHRRVAVVAAGVHLAEALRRVQPPAQLLHVQRVEVGAQRDARALAVLQGRDHAGAGQTAVHRQAHQRERLRHDVGGAVLFERGLGVGVDVAAPGDHALAGVFGNVEVGIHGIDSFGARLSGRIRQSASHRGRCRRWR
jgi:hypothetical protein